MSKKKNDKSNQDHIPDFDFDSLMRQVYGINTKQMKDKYRRVQSDQENQTDDNILNDFIDDFIDEMVHDAELNGRDYCAEDQPYGDYDDMYYDDDDDDVPGIFINIENLVINFVSEK